MAKTQVQMRMDEIRELETKDFHKLFTAPKSRILMLLDFLENGGDLEQMAEDVPNNRKRGKPKKDPKSLMA